MAFTINAQLSLLLKAINDWPSCLEVWNSVHCVLLDLTKAFDLVPHCCLLLKRECLGIRGNLLSHDLNHFYLITVRELLLMVDSQNCFLFIQVYHKAQFLGPCYFYYICIDEIHHIISNIYLRVTLPYTSKLLHLVMKTYFNKTWLKYINGHSCGNIQRVFVYNPY